LIEAARKNHVGFIAQDVEKVIPEVVLYDDSIDMYSIDYTKLTPYIVEAIKEQQIIIKSMQSEIEELKKFLGNNDDKLKSAAITPNEDNIQFDFKNALYQNSPNPFNKNTQIEYFLSEITQNAMINIYDMNGSQLKSIPLNQKGKGSITINGSEFKAGMYMYSLIADGQLIDTKRMVLTD
jgi:hypothetical protein